MKRTFFIIPGFRHSARQKQYQWLCKYLKDKNYIVKTVEVNWNNRVMSDYVCDFERYYNLHKSEENHVLGFSYGAMIAFISAPRLRPKTLSLCSLSPYFQQDLPFLKQSWIAFVGKRRHEDFAQYNADKIASLIDSSTTVFYGSQEGKKYPQLRVRCEAAASTISGAELVIADDAPHKIDDPSYIAAIKNTIHNR